LKEVVMRVSTVVVAFACLVTGFAFAGPRVRALDDVSQARFPSGINVGTRVVMSLGPQSGFSCTIERIDAGWVKCAPDELDAFKKVERPAWYAIAHVTDVRVIQQPTR
jgi:hypothetical protein